MKSRQLSGYIDVSITDSGRHLFYWVVHSERSFEDDPVILWLTGGPGCSSMDALIYENGPYTFQAKGDEVMLKENPYSWSKVATMIYVDSPAGAGLSYSDSKEDYNTNDTQTIDDLGRFITRLMEEMPELASKDLYLAGESYAGVFVPKLARKILKLNEASATSRINIQGYLVGNPVTDDVIEGNAQVDYAFNMGLMDPPTHQALYQAPCRGSFWNATPGSECKNKVKEAFHTFYWVNPYDILEPCTSTSNHRGDISAEIDTYRRQLAMFSSRPPLMHWRSSSSMLKHTVPCADRRAALLWISKDEVRQAIHAAPVDMVPWQPCSDILNYSIIDLPIDIVPIHQSLHLSGLRALVYSGDHDFIIPFIGTRDWVYQRMGLETIEPYSAWTMEGQVAGFVTKFKGDFTFATIKGAGHMAPQTNPVESLELLARFLRDEL